MTTEWKLVPVEPTEGMIEAVEHDQYTFATGDEEWIGCVSEDMAREIYTNMLAAAPVPPAGGEVEVLTWRYQPKDGLRHPAYTEREAQALAYDANPTALVDLANVTRLQAENAELRSTVSTWRVHHDRVQAERDALKAEAHEDGILRVRYAARADELEARLTQATAIINYLWLHTELDAIAKSDIDKFYSGSTDAEKVARAEMVRVANEPAVQDRESKVNELVEFIDHLSGGVRHFAGAIIDAGWVKSSRAPAAKCETCDGTGHDLDGGMNPMGGVADCLDCGGRGTAAKGERYECVGKGGEYALVGESAGAGLSKGQTLMVYQDALSGRLFHREWVDWNNRMQVKS